MLELKDIGVVQFKEESYNIRLKELKYKLGVFKSEYDLDITGENEWDEKKQRMFVEFILRGGKSAPFYFCCDGWSFGSESKLYLLDGKERLNAILKFLDGEFSVFQGYYAEDIKLPLVDVSYVVIDDTVENVRELFPK